MTDKVPPEEAPPKAATNPDELSDEQMAKVSAGLMDPTTHPRPQPMLPVGYTPTPGGGPVPARTVSVDPAVE